MVNTVVSLDVEPITPEVGAKVSGIDLSTTLEKEVVQAIRQAVLDCGVVFFRDQDLSREQMLDFMTNFGTPCMDPFAAIDTPVPPELTITDMPTLDYRPRPQSGISTLRSPRRRRA